MKQTIWLPNILTRIERYANNQNHDGRSQLIPHCFYYSITCFYYFHHWCTFSFFFCLDSQGCAADGFPSLQTRIQGRSFGANRSAGWQRTQPTQWHARPNRSLFPLSVVFGKFSLSFKLWKCIETIAGKLCGMRIEVELRAIEQLHCQCTVSIGSVQSALSHQYLYIFALSLQLGRTPSSFPLRTVC